jgi:hypothetical protein
MTLERAVKKVNVFSNLGGCTFSFSTIWSHKKTDYMVYTTHEPQSKTQLTMALINLYARKQPPMTMIVGIEIGAVAKTTTNPPNTMKALKLSLFFS